ncbi:MAG: DUF4292 domain-containing protein [Bacteroidetes bacterium]|nr:DUF4292 domain-containing protein [Bacteroidota bacterium]
MKKLALLFVGLILVVGCKSLTPVTTTAAIDTSLRPRMAQQKIAASALAFETLQWRGHAVLDRDGKRQKISVSTRLKQDEGIWINGSVIVPLARIFITPKQLQGYEKINRKYAQIDFRALKKLLGVPVDYEILENLLTAKPVDARAFRRAKLSFTKNAYVFSLRKRGVELQFVFDAEFRLTEQRLKDGKTTVSVLYDAYKKMNGQWIPEQLSATLFGEKGATTLTLSVRQSQLNGSVNMPFTIPKGYTSIFVE